MRTYSTSKVDYEYLEQNMLMFLLSGIKPTYDNYDIFIDSLGRRGKNPMKEKVGITFNQFKNVVRNKYELKVEIDSREMYSNEDIEEAFLECAKIYGPKFTRKQYTAFSTETDWPSYSTVYSRFGSFNKAKRKFLGKDNVNYWGSTLGVDTKQLVDVDLRLFMGRIEAYKEMEIETEMMIRNAKNAKTDREFADFCLVCAEIKGCRQIKSKCPYWDRRNE